MPTPAADDDASASEVVSRLGELGLLRRIAERIGPGPTGEVWAGDDAALVGGPEDLLLTTDMLVEGVDFDLGRSSYRDLGWRSVAVNVSDIAAMGGSPLHALASVALPTATPTDRFDELLEGMLEAAAEWGVVLVGGDLSRGESIVIAVVLTGVPGGRGPLLRAGARPGQAICVTGSLGGAAAGLWLLRSGEGGAGLGAEDRGHLLARQLRPTARVEAGRVLAEMGATAAIDVSDGLLLDLWRLLEASGCGCEVTSEAVPVDPAAARLAAVDAAAPDPTGLALGGGEDYELLFTIEERSLARLDEALRAAGTTATRIGTVTHGRRLVDGRSFDEGGALGWDHLRER